MTRWWMREGVGLVEDQGRPAVPFHALHSSSDLPDAETWLEMPGTRWGQRHRELRGKVAVQLRPGRPARGVKLRREFLLAGRQQAAGRGLRLAQQELVRRGEGRGGAPVRAYGGRRRLRPLRAGRRTHLPVLGGLRCEPRPIRELVLGICRAAGIETEPREVPRALALAAGSAVERIWQIGARLGRITSEPPLTHFLAEQLGTAHWFDPRPARDDLGWSPTVSIDEGLRRLAEWYAVAAR